MQMKSTVDRLIKQFRRKKVVAKRKLPVLAKAAPHTANNFVKAVGENAPSSSM
jgi:hypothetical protein